MYLKYIGGQLVIVSIRPDTEPGQTPLYKCTDHLLLMDCWNQMLADGMITEVSLK